jgi:hypothetical protein
VVGGSNPPSPTNEVPNVWRQPRVSPLLIALVWRQACPKGSNDLALRYERGAPTLSLS